MSQADRHQEWADDMAGREALGFIVSPGEKAAYEAATQNTPEHEAIAVKNMAESMLSGAQSAVEHANYLLKIAQSAVEMTGDPQAVYSAAVRFIEEAHRPTVRWTNVGNLPQQMYRMVYQMGVSAGK